MRAASIIVWVKAISHLFHRYTSFLYYRYTGLCVLMCGSLQVINNFDIRFGHDRRESVLDKVRTAQNRYGFWPIKKTLKKKKTASPRHVSGNNTHSKLPARTCLMFKPLKTSFILLSHVLSSSFFASKPIESRKKNDFSVKGDIHQIFIDSVKIFYRLANVFQSSYLWSTRLL